MLVLQLLRHATSADVDALKSRAGAIRLDDSATVGRAEP
jgi:hypothetical protein